MTGYVESHYARTRAPDPARPPLQGHRKTEICVIGGGLAGLNTALGLAERGKRDVVLLEAHRVGWGASGRNGGFVGTHYAAEFGAIERRVGHDHAVRLIRLTRRAVDLIRARIERYGIDCGPIVDDHVGCSWYDDPDRLKAWVAFERQHLGEDYELIPRERLREEYADSPMYFDGLIHRGVFWFHPLNYCLGVARAAEGLGVTIHEETPVTALVADGQPKLLMTPRGLVEADHVVVATGAYNRSLVPELGAAFQQVATYIVVTEPVEKERIAAAIKCRNAIFDDRFSLDYYRRLEDDRILWGGRGTTLTREPSDLRRRLLGDMRRVYPQLDGVRAETAWSGLMSFPRHRMIQVGRLRPGLWYGQGFGGQGMGPTTVAGEALAGAIAEGDDTIELFRPFGLDWTGGPVGKLYGEIYRMWVRSHDAVTTARARRRAGRPA